MLQKIINEPFLREADIVVKCKKYPQFHKELKDMQKSYSTDLNMSIYANLQSIEKIKCFDILNRDKLYINFYGYRMKQSEEDLHKIYLFWISKMDQLFRQNIRRKYSIVYYNSLTQSVDAFVFLRDTFKKLPIQYYALLDKFYVVQSTFFLRNVSLFEFGRLNKLFNRRIVHIDSIKQFCHIDQVQKNQIVDIIPDVLNMENNFQEHKKKAMSQIIQPSSIIKKTIKKNCLTVSLMDHKFDQNNMPVFIMSLIQTMRKYPEMMSIEGIFRKAGSVEDEDQIINSLPDLKSGQTLKMPQTGIYSGYAIAGVIKKFFTNLETPIVPYKIYNKVISLQKFKEEEEIEIVKNIIFEIPPFNRKIMLYVINFIRTQILSYQSNKMNFHGMSVIFTPCFFRAEALSVQDLFNSGRFAGILKILFYNYEQIIGNEEQNKMEKRGSKESQGSKGSRGSKGNSLKIINTNVME